MTAVTVLIQADLMVYQAADVKMTVNSLVLETTVTGGLLEVLIIPESPVTAGGGNVH